MTAMSLSSLIVWMSLSVCAFACAFACAAVHPYSSRCGTILRALFNHFTKLFPKAVVVIKRGGDQFLDYARLAYADVTICSASTFCLWPALANRGDSKSCWICCPTSFCMPVYLLF